MDFNEQKEKFANLLLDACPFMHINSIQEDVVIPDFLKNESLVLRIGRNPEVLGMPDLIIDNSGFRGTISIRGSRYWVDVPWSSVDGMWVNAPFSGPTIKWPKIEVKKEIENEKKDSNIKKLRPFLRAVK